jgi:hypothetical protein
MYSWFVTNHKMFITYDKSLKPVYCFDKAFFEEHVSEIALLMKFESKEDAQSYCSFNNLIDSFAWLSQAEYKLKNRNTHTKLIIEEDQDQDQDQDQYISEEEENYYDDDDDDDEFTPYSGYYATGNGGLTYAHKGEGVDMTACDSECGYCGRCQY